MADRYPAEPGAKDLTAANYAASTDTADTIAVCAIAASPAWHNFAAPVFGGRESHIETGEPYATMRLADLFAMPPTAHPKIDALAFIPSTYREHDARAHAVQQERGAYVTLTADIDAGDHPLATIEGVVSKFAGNAAWSIYSSGSSRPGDRRWRAVIPLRAPVDFQTWHAAQTVFHDEFASADIVPDRTLARAGQIVFAPNVPSVHEKSGTHLREGGKAEGAPLFFECSRSGIAAPGLDLDRCGSALEILERIEDNQAEDARRRAAADEAKRKRAESTGTGSTAIERFNATNDLADLLVKYGYEESPSNGADWRSPHQESGSYATRVSADDDGRQWWFSLSGSDREAGLGRECPSGCHGDAFDLFVHYDHGGDRDAALAAFRASEAAHAYDGTDVPLPEYKPGSAPEPACRSRFDLELFWAGDALPPAKPWLLHNVLPWVAVGMLVAPSMAGKTFLALELARALAEGAQFFGTAPREACGSLLLAGEGMSGLGTRASLLGKLPIAIGTLPVLSDPAELAQLTEVIARDAAKVMRQKFGVRLGLVIIDTLSASGLLPDENNNGEAARAVNAAKLMAHALQCFVLVVHHPGKNGSDSRGAYALHANVDTEIKIDYDEGKPIRIVRLTKSKESPAPKVLGCYTLSQETVGVDAYGDPLTTCRIVTGDYQPEMAKASLVSTLTIEQVQACQEAIAGGDYRAAIQCGSEWAGYAVAKALGLSANERAERSTVQAILDRLLVEGWLRKVPERNPETRKTREFVRVGKPAVGGAGDVVEG